MRITIIKPNMLNERTNAAMQPLFAAALKALTPDDIEIVFYDDRLEEIPYDEPTDLVAISIETFTAKRSYEIIDEYKKRNIRTIAGGFHVTILPDEVLEYADSIVIGNAENTWNDVINDFRNTNLKEVYKIAEDKPLINVEYDKSIFHGKKYIRLELVQWGWGCPYNCDFCSIKTFYKSKPSYRPISDIVNELKGLKNKTVFFVDDNLYHNKDIFIQFLKAITPLKIKWSCQISIDITKDDELLKLMKESGCFLLLIGIESFDIANLKQMNKQWNTAGDGIESAIKKINNYGFLIYGTFIFGYDYDTEDSYKYAVSFAIKHNFFISNFNPLYPMPATTLYKRLKLEQRLLYKKWWLDPEFYYGKSMFQPKTISAAELEEKCLNAKKDFHSWKAIFTRAIGLFVKQWSFARLILYFYLNILNRNEILKKQGKVLGGK